MMIESVGVAINIETIALIGNLGIFMCNMYTEVSVLLKNKNKNKIKNESRNKNKNKNKNKRKDKKTIRIE